MATWDEFVALRDNGYNIWDQFTTYSNGMIVKKNDLWFRALNAEGNLNKDPELAENNSYWKSINTLTFGV